MTTTHPEHPGGPVAPRGTSGAIDSGLDSSRRSWDDEIARLHALEIGTTTFAEAAEHYAAQTARLGGAGERDDGDAEGSDTVPSPTPGSHDDLRAVGLVDELVAIVETRSSSAVLPATGPTVAPTADPARDLDATLTMLTRVQAEMARLEAVRAALAERLRRQAVACEDALIDADDATARTAGAARRHELARRAVVADLATTLHLGESAAATLLDHAGVLVTHAPRMLAALWDGRTSWRHATVLVREVADLEPAHAREVESAVLAVAGTTTPAQFTRAVRRARDLVHPVPLDVRHADARVNRGVWVDPGRDGMAWLTAHLPAVLAHAVDDRLTVAADRLRAGDDPRLTGELRADVLTDLLLDDGTLDLTASALDAAVDPAATPWRGSLAPLARSIRPRVNVTVPVLTLLGASATPATLDGHVPIDAETARALCAHAPSFRRILTHPESGVPLSVGRSTYAVPADLRSLLAERDRTCRFPGCTRPAHRTDLDHTVAWVDGGTTAADNLAFLCRRHHVTKHQTRWHVEQVRGPDLSATQPPGDLPHDQTRDLFGGRLRWTSPTGRVHHTAPGRPVTTTHRRTPRPLLPPGMQEEPSGLPDDSAPPDDKASSPGAALPADPLAGDVGPPPF